MAVPQHLLKYWLPVLLWMALIFSASTDGMSHNQTSRIIAPILRWLHPDMSEETVEVLVGIIRKTAHVVEYAILGMLIWRALRKPRRADTRPWNRGQAVAAFAVGAAYAATDEFHQSFVPSRGASIRDVALDAVGAALGILLVWACHKWRASRRE